MFGLKAGRGCVLVLMITVSLAGLAWGHEQQTEQAAELSESQTLTNNWFGFGEVLENRGIGVSLSVTQIYQQNIHGGLSTHRQAGRFPGSYDLELDLDLKTMLGISGGRVYVLAEGSWSDGIDGPAVGSTFGVNGDAGGYRSIDVTQCYYEQAFWDGAFFVRVGKIDLTGGFECRGCPASFDGNSFANDETTQFLNGGLGNNPAIPFPDNGLGVMAHWQPQDWCYVSAGVADAQADARESGFNTTFNGDNYFFCILEAGVHPRLDSASGPLQGAYRVGLWYDPQPKDRLDGSGRERDDVGVYISLDQVVWKESEQAGDSQGLAAFARYGLANGEINEIEHFWSLGAQYQGLIPGRDDDVLGCGLASGRLSRDGGYASEYESAVELYYNAQILPWLHVSPSVQYVSNPGGGAAKDATIVGVRVQMSF